MTELTHIKIFTRGYIVSLSKKDFRSIFEVMDKLEEKNQELEEENEQLKHDATVLIQANQDYRKENEQLKKELEKISLVNELLSMDLKESEHELWKENEQLKQENKRLHTEWRMQKKIIETYGKRVNR